MFRATRAFGVHVAPWSVEWRISPSSPTTTSELPERITPFRSRKMHSVREQFWHAKYEQFHVREMVKDELQ